MESRREALKIIGAVGVTCSFPFSANELYGQHVHRPLPAPQEDRKPQGASQPRFFDEMQFEKVSRIADLIIPPTDTPGAIGAGVPKYIDFVVSEDPKIQITFRRGLRLLDSEAKSKFGAGFMQLSEAQQMELLRSFSDAARRKSHSKEGKIPEQGLFFKAIKNLTADGYYTSRVGLLQELGYNGNAALSSFPESSIPEH